ncbi:hypothetical protein ANO14919_007660 [Xylariales sp. No.14919]|nr:hypothetical protein ANO14919_007660 [Xylariales sp. No.14919]
MASASNINGQLPALNTRVSAAVRDPEPRLLLPGTTPAGSRTRSEGVGNPLIICFHGSGETCSPSWDDLVAKLLAETHCRVLRYDRGPGNLRAADVAAQMWDYVCGTRNPRSENESLRDESVAQNESGLNGPYLLIAHSYGGAFARAFVQHERLMSRRQWWKSGTANRVLGLVLVETGQEGGLDAALDEQQIRNTIMGDRPVCVIRGNSLIGKWAELEKKEKATDTPEAGMENAAMRRQVLAAEREMLLRIDAEDERLKRRQLGLSKNSRFVHVPDCGHHVVRDRPDEVVAAVRWVLENAEAEEEKVSAWKRTWGRMKAILPMAVIR